MKNLVNKKAEIPLDDVDFEDVLEKLEDIDKTCEQVVVKNESEDQKKKRIASCKLSKKEQLIFNVRRGSLAEDIVKDALVPYCKENDYKISRLSRNYVGNDPGKFIEFLAEKRGNVKGPKKKIILADAMTANNENYIIKHCDRGYEQEENVEDVFLFPISNNVVVNKSNINKIQENCNDNKTKKIYHVCSFRNPNLNPRECEKIVSGFSDDHKSMLEEISKIKDFEKLETLEERFKRKI